MQPKINDKTEGIYPEINTKGKESTGEKIDTSKLEGEGACELIAGKDEKKVCEVKT